MCNHRFIVHDVRATSRFLCRECDERFVHHPDVAPSTWPHELPLLLNDTIHINDCGVWKAGEVKGITRRDSGWIAVYYPRRDYMLDVQVKHLSLGYCFDTQVEQIWQYKHLHEMRCTMSCCFFGDVKCPGGSTL